MNVKKRDKNEQEPEKRKLEVHQIWICPIFVSVAEYVIFSTNSMVMIWKLDVFDAFLVILSWCFS